MGDRPNRTVLVTGANGILGGGYHVRATLEALLADPVAGALPGALQSLHVATRPAKG